MIATLEQIEHMMLTMDLNDPTERLVLSDYLEDVDRNEEAGLLRNLGKDPVWESIVRIRYNSVFHPRYLTNGKLNTWFIVPATISQVDDYYQCCVELDLMEQKGLIKVKVWLTYGECVENVQVFTS